MKALLELDCASIFLKQNRILLLKKLFGEKEIFVSNFVASELKNSFGRNSAKILSSVNSVELNSAELKELKELRKKHEEILEAELSCFIACRKRHFLLISNDHLLNELCEREKARFIDLEELLRAFLIKKILNQSQLYSLIKELEHSEGLIIHSKQELLN
ncbi:MAG: hypothetical protein AB1467_04325 [Candidatus Diapherotrites archaeon]